MKKAFLAIGLLIAFILIYILQSNFFSWFTIAGIKPNLFIILVLFVGLFAGRIYGMSFGIILGLFLDIFIGRKIGVSSILYGALGILGGILDKNFSKDSKITIVGMVAVSTIIFELFAYIINSTIYTYIWEWLSVIKIILIETIYNSILTIILYPIIQRVGFSIQDMFKENKILTRYY